MTIRVFGSARLRVLRDEEASIDGIAALDCSSLSSWSAPVRWTWVPTDSGTARSSDLAWTMGRYRASEASGATKTDYYVRVWRAERGTWKIVSDVLAPIEAPAR